MSETTNIHQTNSGGIVQAEKIETENLTMRDSITGNTSISGEQTNFGQRDFNQEKTAVGRDQYNTAEGDIHQVNYYSQTIEETLFSEWSPDPDHQKPPLPIFTDKLQKKVLGKKILILGGGVGFDQFQFLKNLALKIQGFDACPRKILIQSKMEFEKSNLDFLEKLEADSIILLRNVTPDLFNYNLQSLSNKIEEKNHLILAYSQEHEKRWGLTASEREHYWYNLPDPIPYNPEDLNKEARRKLQAFQNRTEPDFYNKIKPKLDLIGIEQIGARLKTPGQISFFFNQLPGLKEDPSDKNLQELLKDSQAGEEERIKRWFVKLNEPQKLIAIAASLMDGLYEDQFFAIFQEIVDKNWQKRVSRLLGLDFDELNFLLDFFTIEEFDDKKRVIRSHDEQYPLKILETAWPTHRRHILFALDHFFESAKTTTDTQLQSWAKYGTRDRRSVLRESIALALSRLGTINFFQIEYVLLGFASYSSQTLKRVVALTISHWVKGEHEKLALDVFNRWIHDQSVTEIVLEFLVKNGEIEVDKSGKSSVKRTGKATDQIYSTLVACLQNISKSYPQNKLPGPFADYFVKLAKVDTPGVQREIEKLTPTILSLHTEQFIQLIEEELIKLVA